VGTHGRPLYLEYHDQEWGMPSHDDRHLFELLTLEGAQAGLSWATILHKRECYRSAFAGFDPVSVARLDRRRSNVSCATRRLSATGSRSSRP
jgi:DNA-3-methyladenine glycosylase I